MAKYEDFVKARSEENKVETELAEAAQQQETRETTVPVVDWERRYKDLEVAYSQQGNQIGEYRQLVDDYISTPSNSQEDSVDVSPITPDEIYENPDEAVRRAVDSHPAIQEAREIKAMFTKQESETQAAKFKVKHPDFETITATPEFANWVKSDMMRLELAQRAHNFDMTAADALFTLWESEQTVQQTVQETQTAEAVAAAGLETGSGAEPPAPELYSRSDMLDRKIRAKQGDLEAERYVKAHAVRYREALGQGNVRD